MKLYGSPGSPYARKVRIVLDDGRGLYDSPVIVEYLDTLGSGPRLLPEALAERIEVKRWEALGDGIAEATVNINHERREPSDKQKEPAWFQRQRDKIDRGLAAMEKQLGQGPFCFGGRFTLADIAAGYALGYLDFATPDIEWRKGHPALAKLAERLFARPSFATTLHAQRR